MLNQPDGVNYKYAEDVAEMYGYSIFHIRHLAREYKRGDTEKGLKGFKYRGRWVLCMRDVTEKLSFEQVELSVNEREDKGNDAGRQQKQPQTIGAKLDELADEDSGDDWI